MPAATTCGGSTAPALLSPRTGPRSATVSAISKKPGAQVRTSSCAAAPMWSSPSTTRSAARARCAWTGSRSRRCHPKTPRRSRPRPSPTPRLRWNSAWPMASRTRSGSAARSSNRRSRWIWARCASSAVRWCSGFRDCRPRNMWCVRPATDGAGATCVPSLPARAAPIGWRFPIPRHATCVSISRTAPTGAMASRKCSCSRWHSPQRPTTSSSRWPRSYRAGVIRAASPASNRTGPSWAWMAAPNRASLAKTVRWKSARAVSASSRS